MMWSATEEAALRWCARRSPLQRIHCGGATGMHHGTHHT